MTTRPSDHQLAVAKQIDAVCDDFESEWQSGSRPEISHYLRSETSLPQETLLIELIRIDIEYRQQTGETPSARDYVEKFPEFEDTILRLSTSAEIQDDLEKAATRTPFSSDIPTFDRYELHGELGRGSFGVVWKAWDSILERWVAVKIARVSGSEQVQNIFHREAKALASLKDPHVIQVLDFGIKENLAYIVFELVEGENLSATIKNISVDKKSISIDQAVNITLQIATGLEHVHKQGVIHRDLKPSNILIDDQKNVRIADFGLARQVDRESTIGGPGNILGTVPYMSPEQLDGQEINYSTDTYSLGVIFYQLLTGEYPYSGTRDEIRRKIAEASPQPPCEINAAIPKELEAVCLRAMAKNPRHRFAKISEMRHALEQYQVGETILVKPPGRWEQLQDQVFQMNRRTALVAVGLTGLGAMGARWMTVPIPAPPPKDVDIPVTLVTEPPGAKLVLHPINYETGLPEPEKRIVVEDVSPVEIALKPGDYLVVAYFEDGRFHEVYRHVRASNESTFQPSNYHISSRIKEGRHILPIIKIPKEDPTAGMILVKGHPLFVLLPHYQKERVKKYRLPDYYVDQYEVTQGHRREQNAQSRYKESFITDGPDFPVHKNHVFDRFVSSAEMDGKRLLTDLEFYYAATNGGKTKYPWGDEMHPDATAVGPELQPVGRPPFDQTQHTPPIFGLCSGVAEWVDDQFRFSPVDQQKAFISALDRNRFAIKGGSRKVILGNLIVTAEDRNPRTTEYSDRLETFDGLGCRYARSARARLKPEDFQTLIVTDE